MLINKHLQLNTDLFEEIKETNAETISGGQATTFLVSQESPIMLSNSTNAPIYLDLNYGELTRDYRLNPGASQTFFAREDQGRIDYDKSFCQVGIQNQAYTLTAGKKYDFQFSSGSSCNIQLYDSGNIA
ncbi:hypothetical protein [Nostoc sp. UHCC 0251]|uniref:hypothetical protein n=1 Tax=Nostoc sp. UHCC 0251 TaxID=3110240 RepID=UPI002B1EDA83|nr:hypothetical protein [Nostoc sp. UHCC 0251]MEA5624551.1 hypothetical protein [Nostoc sp. UHCC 0251]